MSNDWIVSEKDRDVLPAIVYVRLHNALKRYRDTIVRSIEHGDIPYVAWLARNILELRVWVEYCAMYAKHAQEFYDDAARDLVDLNKGNLDLEPEQRVELNNAAAALPATKDTHRYKKVRQAAKDCGLTVLFEGNYKSLSKLAHPTALSVIVPVVGDGAKAMRLEIVHLAHQLAQDGLARLKMSILGDAYRKYGSWFDAVNPTQPPEMRIVLE
jgi:hypothetical protein